jgi:hypothetical protein
MAPIYVVLISVLSIIVFLYKVLSITCGRLLRSTCINYNAIEFLRRIAFNSNIRKQVLFLVYKVYYRRVFKYN